MKKQVMKLVLGMAILTTGSAALAGGGQIGSAGGHSQHLLGRLVESNCNTPTGIAEIKAVVVNSQTNELNYVAMNLVNDSLCIKGFQGFGQPIVNMSLNSLLGADETGAERLRMHEITINENGIATNVSEVPVQGDLAKEYHRFDFRDFNNYPRVEKRYFRSDLLTYRPGSTEKFDNRTPELAAQVREMAK